ncbi:hypothetical protein BZA77DRAFT_292332 [Pyronema omphalodes]|nr:hypothetical protein BZA77DRAFT_292332 [Pyronema omphalodes]
MSNIGNPAQLRESDHHSPAPSAVPSNNQYATSHHLIPHHQHNPQFLYNVNGDLGALQAQQYRTDIFNPDPLNWQQQQQQQHITQGFPQHQQYGQPPGPILHPHLYPPTTAPLAQQYGQISPGVWSQPVSNPNLYAQNGVAVPSPQIPNVINSRPTGDHERQAPNEGPHQINQANQFQDYSAQGVSNVALTWIDDFPNVSVHGNDEFPDAHEALEKLSYLGDILTSTVVANKKPRLGTPASAPSPTPASPSNAPSGLKSTNKTATRSKVPTEPVAKIRYLLQECLETEDDDLEASKIAASTWDIIVDVVAEQTDLVNASVNTILKSADDETLLLSQIRMPLELYEKQVWERVLTIIHKKSELDKSREFATLLITRYQQLDKEKQRKDREKKSRSNISEKGKPVTTGNVTAKKEGNSNLNAGVKRTIDEVGKGAASGAAKKVAIGDARNPVSSSNSQKPAAPSGPIKTGAPASSSNAGDKKPATANAASSNAPIAPSTTAVAAAKSKPPASSGFFKTLGKSVEPAKSATKAPEKKPTAPSADAPPTTSFTSIFSQLLQRQNEQGQKNTDAANKTTDATRSNDDDKKKKKSVRWKTGDDLVKVQMIEWIEPEGEYYGGGSSSMEGNWGDGAGEGEALKNKNFIDEDEDMIDWYQPIAINLEASLYQRQPNARDYPEKRGGQQVVESEEAKIQAQRELVTLAAFYTSTTDIPPSPKEPDESADKHPVVEPTVIPLPDEIKTKLGIPLAPVIPISQPVMPAIPAVQQTTDLSSLLTAFQQPQQPQAQPAVNPLFATLQAFGIQPPQPQQQQPAAVPQPPQLDLTALLSAFGQQPQQSLQPQAALPQQMQPNFLQSLMPQMPQQAQGGQSNAVADIIARLTNFQQPNVPTGFPQMPVFPGLIPPFQQPVQQPAQEQPPAGPRNWGYDQPQQEQQQQQSAPTRDVRRELRESVGWSDNNVKDVPPAATGSNAGNGGSGGNQKWGKKKKLPGRGVM